MFDCGRKDRRPGDRRGCSLELAPAHRARARTRRAPRGRPGLVHVTGLLELERAGARCSLEVDCARLTHSRARALEVDMDENTLSEAAFVDYLNAREAALNAAVGSLVADNVSAAILARIVETATEQTIVLAARIALHRRERS